MRVFTTVACLVASASAFCTPNPLRSKTNAGSQMGTAARQGLDVKNPRLSVHDMPVDIETAFAIFDPLNLALDEEALYRRRCVEIKHGRIAMAAVVGLLVPDIMHTLPGTLSFSRNLRFSDVPTGLNSLETVPPLGWVQIVAFIGFLELCVLKQDQQRAPGDVGGGGWVRYSEPTKSTKLLIEIKNGRLAMVAVTWMLVSEGVTGQSTAEQLACGLVWSS